MVLIGDRIKSLRNRDRLTQSELAERVFVTKSTIAAYENNSRMPSYDVLIRLSSVFKVSTDMLLLNTAGASLDVSRLTADQIDILRRLMDYFSALNELEAGKAGRKQPHNA